MKSCGQAALDSPVRIGGFDPFSGPLRFNPDNWLHVHSSQTPARRTAFEENFHLRSIPMPVWPTFSNMIPLLRCHSDAGIDTGYNDMPGTDAVYINRK